MNLQQHFRERRGSAGFEVKAPGSVDEDPLEFKEKTDSIKSGINSMFEPLRPRPNVAHTPETAESGIFNPAFEAPIRKSSLGGPQVKPMSAAKASNFNSRMGAKASTKLPGPDGPPTRPGRAGVRSGRPNRGPPPKIDIMAEARQLEEHAKTANTPTWEAKPKTQAVVINKMGTHFGKPVEDSAPKKSAMEVVRERKRAKKEAEDAAKATAEAAERVKFDHMPEWKKAMFLKKDKEKKESLVPDQQLAARAKEVEESFADLPQWQQERAIKKEKRRILQEEGLIIP